MVSAPEDPHALGLGRSEEGTPTQFGSMSNETLQRRPTCRMSLHLGYMAISVDYPKTDNLCKPLFYWWARLDSNQRPRDYESPALTV